MTSKLLSEYILKEFTSARVNLRGSSSHLLSYSSWQAWPLTVGMGALAQGCPGPWEPQHVWR